MSGELKPEKGMFIMILAVFRDFTSTAFCCDLCESSPQFLIVHGPEVCVQCVSVELSVYRNRHYFSL